MRKYKCFYCGKIIDHFEYRYDSAPNGDDISVCPECGHDDGFEEVESLDKESCEKLMLEKINELLDIFHRYDPAGSYLSLAYINENDDNYLNCYSFEDHGNMPPINILSYKNKENGNDL